MSKILYEEVEKPLFVELNKTIKSDTTSGIMDFGVRNNYPNLLEALIQNSQTGKAAAETLASFIVGEGFENQLIGNIVVGIDNKGREITLNKMLRQVATSISYFNGFYIHTDINLGMKVSSTKLVPFKQCRLSIADADGFCGKVAFYNDWTKRAKNKDIKWFNIFNSKPEIIKYQIENNDEFNGQMYYSFLDENYLYPLSIFDVVDYEMDTEAQIQIFKNREIRNGFSKKFLIQMPLGDDDKVNRELIRKMNDFAGPDGDKTMIIETQSDENGNILPSAFQIQQIETNIDKDTFENNWNKDTSNNIRIAAKNLPAILINYEESKLGGTSGEAIIQATNFYNNMTKYIRDHVSECFKELYSNFDNETLANNDNWNIIPLTINE
jgi:hypothetical protein